MPKRIARAHRLQHAVCRALVQERRPTGQARLDQPGFDGDRRQRGKIERFTRGGAEARGAREDRVAQRGRDTFVAAREQLGHEKRIAAGQRVELAGDGIRYVVGKVPNRRLT
ncbi:MAG: hypothetical protein H0T80_11935 [Betaproteobacteria bacterium]|nr:hypothetical protein [Betaproteobacteria bacterium]